MKTLYVILFGIFLITATLQSKIINVPTDIDSIQGGINLADNGDTVLVQPDTYVENINFNGKNIVVGSVFLTIGDTSYISQTLIDGDSSGCVVTFENEEDSTAVLIGFTIRNGLSGADGGGIYCESSSPSILNCLIIWNSAVDGGGVSCQYGASPTISDCFFNWNSAALDGGGIYCESECNPIITNCTINENWAGDEGGGIYCEINCSPIISNIVVNNNEADYRGGGIHCDDNCNLSLENVTVSQNTALNDCGGIFCRDNCNLSLENVTVSHNTAGDDGGGLLSYYSNLQIENCDFTGNTAQGDYGGAISYWNYGDPSYTGVNYQIVISNSHFSNNTATNIIGGVGIGHADEDSSLINVIIDNCEFINNFSDHYTGLYIAGNMSDFTVSNCVISGNTAVQYGAGAGFHSESSGVVSNCLFTSNIASTGGGNWNSGGAVVWGWAKVDFMNCTFTDNSSAYGAGLTVGRGSVATTTNCIFWGNSTDQIALATYQNVGGTLTVNYCDIQDGIDSINVIDPVSTLIWGDGNIAENPLFVNPENGDYHLQNLSPCISAGVDSIEIGDLWYYCPTGDIEGNLRPNPVGSKPDMGAYESELGVVGIEYIDLQIPEVFILDQNYPNPFNPSTKIKFSLPKPENVIIEVYNTLGQRVETLLHRRFQAGNHEIEFNAQSLSSGVYYYRIEAGEFSQVKKMILLK